MKESERSRIINKEAGMFKYCLQVVCLACAVFAANQPDVTGRWDWIKSYRGGFAGGWVTPADVGYSMHMVFRNDSAFTYHDDALARSESLATFIRTGSGTVMEVRTDTLVIMETHLEAIPASYWKKAATADTSAGKPPILFLVSRVNNAWGYMHEGWFVDSCGAVRNYQFAAADSVGYFSLTDSLPMRVRNRLIAKSTPTTKKIPMDTLLSKTALIEAAGAGALSLFDKCRDAGIYRYSAFLRNALHPQPREIICYQIGDAAVCNSSPAARKIARWLNSIDTENISFCAPADSCLKIPTTFRLRDRALPEYPERMAMNGTTLTFSVIRNATAIIRFYSLQGVLVAKPFKRFLNAGKHRINLASMIPETQYASPMIVECSLNGNGPPMRIMLFPMVK
jgi:hypothetical protein